MSAAAVKPHAWRATITFSFCFPFSVFSASAVPSRTRRPASHAFAATTRPTRASTSSTATEPPKKRTAEIEPWKSVVLCSKSANRIIVLFRQ
ncbi:hypothetical protein BDR26DRAFT_590743 [Obelidium mucronatum]|nr:hypothetical protein BDR26DRAFT_590743 [Obelidium mucronatum]